MQDAGASVSLRVYVQAHNVDEDRFALRAHRSTLGHSHEDPTGVH